MNTIAPPTFRQIDHGRCLEILGRNDVGIIAYAGQNHIDIEPVHYVCSDGWIFGRTSKGRKMERTGYSWWPVPFVVDEVEELVRWRSVVVHGGSTRSPPGAPTGRSNSGHAGVELLRILIPQTFAEKDATRHSARPSSAPPSRR